MVFFFVVVVALPSCARRIFRILQGPATSLDGKILLLGYWGLRTPHCGLLGGRKGGSETPSPMKKWLLMEFSFPRAISCSLGLKARHPKGRLVAGWEAMLQNLRSIPDMGAFKSHPSKAEEAPEQGSAHRSPRSNSGLHLFL